MSVLAAKLEEVREAAVIAKKLSPAMIKAMTVPPGPADLICMHAESRADRLVLVYPSTNTRYALISRNLLAQDKDTSFFTELGLLVRDILLRGAEVMLAEATYSERSTGDLNLILHYNTLSDVHRKVIMTLLHDRALEEYVARRVDVQSAPPTLAEAQAALRQSPQLATARPCSALLPGHVHCLHGHAEDCPAPGDCEYYGAKGQRLDSPADWAGHRAEARQVTTPAALRNDGTGFPLLSASLGALLQMPQPTKASPESESQQGPISLDDFAVERTPLRHEVLARVSERQYFSSEGQLYQRERGGRDVSILKTHVVEILVLIKAGLVKEGKTVFGPGTSLRPTAAGNQLLVAWDIDNTRDDFPDQATTFGVFANTARVGVPPREVLVERPTKAVVKKFSEYYITGPGRVLADEVLCEHEYRLTDSCPLC